MNEGRNSKRGGERCSTDDASGTEEVERENLRVGMRVRVQCMTGYTKGVVIDFSRDCVHAITGNSSLVSVVKLTGEHGLMVESDKQPRPLPSSKYILIRRDQRLAIKLIAAKNEELAASQ